MRKCTPLKCKTFAKFALAPARTTLPRLTQEEIHPVDSIVINCPYRNKDCTCRNKNETFEAETYPAPEAPA